MDTKTFAAPGIDSTTAEQGVYNSGAGLHPDTDTKKKAPYDWRSFGPTQDLQSAPLIGTHPTPAPNASSLKVRRRGLSPFDGPFKTAVPTVMKRGGIADMNPGAGSVIAGGRGAVSSLVRVNALRTNKVAGDNRNMREVITLKPAFKRGRLAPLPSGDSVPGTGVKPVFPTTGQPSVFGFIRAGKQVQK